MPKEMKPKCETKGYEHQYDLSKYQRDDQGFYLDCIHCGRTQMFEANTVAELYEIFGMNDDD